MCVSETTPYPTLVSRLESTAGRFPARIAVQDEERVLTFSALAEEITALAAKIQAQIVPGDHVAVRLKRGVDYIVAAYAIWKAGGVYLPLDDQWPEQRIEGILRQAHVRVLIHSTTSASGIALITVAGTQRVKQADIGMPAYIIHTSGTTGTPKGVVVSHESLLHLVDSHQRHIYLPHGITQGPVVMNASFCFDSSLERLALVALGYSVHVVSDQVRKSPHELVSYLRDHHIINVDLVPSHLKVLLSAGVEEVAGALRLVIVGGEAIDTGLWQQLAASRVIYFNVYGPTENTINTTFCQIQGAVSHIGRPFENVDCLIVGEYNQLCPAGEVGELWVAGRHLSLGYYNAPELTERAFIHFNGQRCYRTGDLVQQDIEGNLLFLGRIDDQVKVNGYRIELADVQHHLAALPTVQFAAVTPVRRSSGHGLLASIVWSPSAGERVLSDLAVQLGEKLPAYMVPDYWQQLTALPLTHNLKLDHKALLQCWQNNQDKSGHGAESKLLSVTERQVQAIWQKILLRSGLEPDAHFFASGGDSIAAMALLVELKKLTRINVALGDIFTYPTIRKMAAWLDAANMNRETA